MQIPVTYEWSADDVDEDCEAGKGDDTGDVDNDESEEDVRRKNRDRDSHTDNMYMIFIIFEFTIYAYRLQPGWQIWLWRTQMLITWQQSPVESCKCLICLMQIPYIQQ